VYKRVLLRDHAGEDISKCLFGCLSFIEHAVQHNQRVLVHCTKGISRSSTVVIAYLMLKRSWDMQKALQFTKQCRPIVNPNCAFFFQLSDWEGSWPQAQFKNGAVLVYKVWQGKSSSENEEGDCSVPRVDGPMTADVLAKLDNPDAAMKQECYVICSQEGAHVWQGESCPAPAYDAAQQACADFQTLGQFASA
jgi:dual specificity MAP kinase phosphatase